MTLKEFMKRSDEARMKHDILLLADLIQLYEEKYKNKKEKVSIEYIFNELHNDLIYIFALTLLTFLLVLYILSLN